MKQALLLAISISAISTGCVNGAVQSLAQAPKQIVAVASEDKIINENGLTIVYPRGTAEIDAPSTFLIGTCQPKANLTVNGVSVRLNGDGYFAHVVPLTYGQNKFVFARGADDKNKLTLTVTRKQPAKPLPESPLRIDSTSIKPAEDQGMAVGDLLEFAVRATPRSALSAHIGSRVIKLHTANPHINQGQNTSYGVAYQNHSATVSDLYTGYYRLQADDHFRDVKPSILATKGNSHIGNVGDSKITVVEQPRVAHTMHDDTIVRFGPSLARATPLAAGVRLFVDGWQGKNMRCLLAPGKHVFISREDLEFEQDGSSPPYSVVRTVNISNDGNSSDARVVVPLTQRLPYQIEQSLTPNKLTLRIFGATADTDWIIPTPGSSVGELIDRVNWNQKTDKLYELTVNLKQKRQWGFWASYEDNNLVLHIKSAPKITSNLNGLTICLDPGHGGNETGSIGPDGTKEGEINYAIATKLKPLLEEAGAKVIMTRLTEADGPTLQDRVAIAVNNKADLLLSVHNNALPDGRDPWAEHGTSSYYYYPQSMELARILKDNLIKKLTTFPDRGVFYQNLALCRPSQMPAVLCEVGFMIHPDEFSQLSRPEIQDKAAHALINGIKEYIHIATQKTDGQ